MRAKHGTKLPEGQQSVININALVAHRDELCAKVDTINELLQKFAR